MEFPEMNVEYDWRTIGIIAVLLLIAVIGVYSIATASPVNIYFEKNGVEANTETALIVEVTNNLDKDVGNLTVQVTPIDPNSVSVQDPMQAEVNVGKGEKRIFRFPVTVGDVRPGTYSLEVEIRLGTVKIDKRTMIEIK